MGQSNSSTSGAPAATVKLPQNGGLAVSPRSTEGIVEGDDSTTAATAAAAAAAATVGAVPSGAHDSAASLTPTSVTAAAPAGEAGEDEDEESFNYNSSSEDEAEALKFPTCVVLDLPEVKIVDPVIDVDTSLRRVAKDFIGGGN